MIRYQANGGVGSMELIELRMHTRSCKGLVKLKGEGPRVTRSSRYNTYVHSNWKGTPTYMHLCMYLCYNLGRYLCRYMYVILRCFSDLQPDIYRASVRYVGT